MKQWGIIFLLASAFACDKSDTPVPVVGEWAWIFSQGGLVLNLLTPTSEGYEEALEITEQQFTEYRDGVEIRSHVYLLYAVKNVDGSLTYIMDLKGGLNYQWDLRGDTLILDEACPDCFVHYYLRQ